MSDEESTMEEPIVEEGSSITDTGYELESMKEQLAQLSQSQQQLLAALKTNTQGVKPQETAELLELAKDPAKFAAYIQQQTAQAKQEIRKESQKEIWDKKAYEDYPVLKTDKVFEAEVKKQMREFVNNGEYQPDNPMLIYRSAQIVASKLNKSPSQGLRRTQGQMTSEAPSQRSRGPGQSQSSVKIPDNDPRLIWGRDVYGIKGESLEKFKKELVDLGPHKPSERKRGRTLVK